MQIVNTDVRYHVENGVVLWDSDDWETLRHETEDTIEAFEVLADLVKMGINERTQEASIIETVTLSKIMGEADHLESTVAPSSFIQTGVNDKFKHELSNNQRYQVIKEEIRAMVVERQKLHRKIRALTRTFVNLHDNFFAQV